MTKRMQRWTPGACRLLACVALSIAVFGIVSCGDGPTSPSSQPNLRLMLTDAPIGNVEKVSVYFTSVTVKPVGQPLQELTLQLPENPVDLLTLDNKVIGFATGVMTPGDFEFLQINLDPTKSRLVERGVEKPLHVASEEIKIVRGFTVDRNKITSLTLDFDAAASLVSLGDGEWLLKPVVVVNANYVNSQQDPDRPSEPTGGTPGNGTGGT